MRHLDDGPLWRRQNTRRLTRSALALGLTIALAGFAPLIAMALPSSRTPFLAAIALTAFAAAVAFASLATDR